MGDIKKNISEIEEDIKKHSLNPEKSRFIAVTKYVGPDEMLPIIDCGVKVFGENKAQVMKDKQEKFNEMGIKDVEWHFIGNLQKNKVKYIASFIDMIHSINKLSLAEEINKRAKEHNRTIEVLIEINLFQEDSKEGYDYQDFLNDIPALLSLENIKIKGLMTMAPYTDNEDFIRSGFKKLRELRDELNILYFNNSLTELSMGMSNDYKLALEEGATLIRVGSKIFE